jgi:hypothetical protein
MLLHPLAPGVFLGKNNPLFAPLSLLDGLVSSSKVEGPVSPIGVFSRWKGVNFSLHPASAREGIAPGRRDTLPPGRQPYLRAQDATQTMGGVWNKQLSSRDAAWIAQVWPGLGGNLQVGAPVLWSVGIGQARSLPTLQNGRCLEQAAEC